MVFQEQVPRHGGRRAGAGRKPKLIAELGGGLESIDVHLEAARTLLRRWRAALLTARGVYATDFRCPGEPSYGAQLRRARRRVETVGARPRRRGQ